jgi:hypothetical protein
MRTMSRIVRLRHLALAASTALGACVLVRDPVVQPSRPAPLPPLPAQEILEVLPPRVERVQDSKNAPISIDLVNAIAANEILRIARDAGLNVVVPPTMSTTTRVTLRLNNMNPLDVIRAIADAAGHGFAVGPPKPIGGPTVFFRAPIHIDSLDAAGLQRIYGVSAEMAKLIVQSRIK